MENKTPDQLLFNLKLTASPSDKDFFTRIGKDGYAKLKEEIFTRDKYTCQGCELNASHNHALILCHVISIDEENILNSPCVTLCMACHATQHIDIAYEKKWVEVVNTIFSQKVIIEMQRASYSTFKRSVNEHNTRYVSDPDKTVEKIVKSTIAPNTKAKIIFTEEFYKLPNTGFVGLSS